MSVRRSSYSSAKPCSTGERSPAMPPKVMSSDVIREAKQWTARATVLTKRPNTPRDVTRELFGNRRDSSSRPPSAISIGPRHFDPNDPDSRPGSAATLGMKLTPLSKAPAVPANAEPVITKVHVPMPPNVTKHDLSVRSQSRNLFSRKASGGANIPLKAFHPEHREPVIPTPPSRNVHSAGEHSAGIIDNVPNTVHKPSPPSSKHSFGTRHKSRSSAGVNINLAQLYETTEDSQARVQQSSTSSSSGGSSAGQPASPPPKRSGGSGQGAGKETADQAKYWNQNVLPLLEVLEDTGQPKDGAYLVCKQLYDALEIGNCMKNMLGRRRTSLLSTLFKQLNGASTPLHLACARIILALHVRRQNLNSVCKMLFKISREKKLDDEFVRNNLIHKMLDAIMGFADPLDNYETLVYLTGTIKFLSDSKSVSQELVNKGCVASCIVLVTNIMASLKVRNHQKKEMLHATDILIQATAVLRSMADIDHQSFIKSNMFLHLMEALEVLVADEALSLNISRLLSKLTMYDDLYAELFHSPVWPSAIWNAIIVHKKCMNVVVRLFFALGNVTAKEEEARMQIHSARLSPSSQNTAYPDPICLSVINSIVEYYLKNFLNERDSAKTPAAKEHIDKSLDVVNKAVRVIANLSISEKPGELIVSDDRCIENILTILHGVEISESEELIVNTLTTLNNLSYYSNHKNAVTRNRIKIAKLLMNVLIADNMSCVMEAARVFGNISRYDDVRILLHDNQVDRMMVALLDSGTWQMVYSSCGVLINVTASQANRASLIEEGIVSKLVDVLKDFAPIEWRVGGVACQLLWNLCEQSPLSDEEADALLEVLHIYLQENAPFQILDSSQWNEDVKHYLLHGWKTEFCPFAIRLYKKISSQHSQLVPLESEEVSSQ